MTRRKRGERAVVRLSDTRWPYAQLLLVKVGSRLPGALNRNRARKAFAGNRNARLKLKPSFFGRAVKPE